LPQANNLGGDLRGIEEKIKDDYLKSLGINTVWVSPITKNPDGAWGLWNKGVTSKFSSYHGYWPTGLRAVDRRFGNAEDLKVY
jgi:cyclomaltodextrinase